MRTHNNSSQHSAHIGTRTEWMRCKNANTKHFLAFKWKEIHFSFCLENKYEARKHVRRAEWRWLKTESNERMNALFTVCVFSNNVVVWIWNCRRLIRYALCFLHWWWANALLLMLFPFSWFRLRFLVDNNKTVLHLLRAHNVPIKIERAQ